jgi:glycerophosphoryl diester phosphodiesterase
MKITSMTFRTLASILACSNLCICSAFAQVPTQTKVIAHRGASGYCIEHTEAAKTLAHAQGADYIEQDVVLTKDLVFVVSHDITMDATTNVASVYPDRKRSDGKTYFVDFTFEELKHVSMKPRSFRVAGQEIVGPGANCGQRILSLGQEVSLLRSLDQATSRRTGLYIELKSPAFHLKETGKRMGELLLAQLRELTVSPAPADCLLQCFEGEELIDMKTRLQCEYPLIHLLSPRDANIDLKAIAGYAFGVGPSVGMLAKRGDNGPVSTGFVEKAKSHGLQVHPYTVRKDQQPDWSQSLDETHAFLVKELAVEGFFTDFPDLGKAAVAN